MNQIRLVLVAGTVLLAAASTANAQVQLSIEDGRVTLVATDVTVRDILAEWARVGQTRIVNGEKLAGPRVTLELRDVPEEQALDVLLRSASGYLVAPRQTPSAAASRFDRILILPTSQAPAAPGRAALPSPSAPTPRPFMPPRVTVPDAEQNFDDFEEQQDVIEDIAEDAAGMPGTAPMPGMATDEQPPETQFNYANPPQLQRLRALQEALAQSGDAVQGDVDVAAPISPYGQVPGTVPSPTMPSDTSAPRPGMIVAPPPPTPVFRNPYGLPSNVQPGSVVAPPQEPDRSKYANPPQGD